MKYLTIILLFCFNNSFSQGNIIAKYYENYPTIGVLDTIVFPEVEIISKISDDFVDRWYAITLKKGYHCDIFIKKHSKDSIFEFIGLDEFEPVEFIRPDDTMYNYQPNLQDDTPLKYSTIYSDNYYPNYFGLSGYLPYDSNEIVGQGIDIEQAWDITTGDSSVWLGFFEAGANWHNHPDLRKAVYNWNYYYNKDTIIQHYHGTPIVGVACAKTNNTTGIAGIAGGWGNKKGCSYVTLDCVSGYNTQYLVLALEELTNLGVPVVNMSFGIPYNMFNANVILFEEAMVRYMTTSADNKLSNGGGVIVAALGNYQEEFNEVPDTFPVSPVATMPGILSMKYDNLIGVGNCDVDDVLSPYSVRGDIISVVAPSRFIASLSTPYDGSMDVNGNDNTGYVTMRDIATSGAAPMVVGVIGLILSEYPNYFTNTDIKEIIEDSADDITNMQVDSVKGKTGHGRLNAYKALIEAKNKIRKRKSMF